MNGYFHGDIILHFFVIEGAGLNGLSVSVDVTYQVGDAAVKEVSPLDIALALIRMQMAGKCDFQTLVQISDFLEVGNQHVKVVFDYRENLLVGLERNRGASFCGLVAFNQASARFTTLVVLIVHITLAADLSTQVY